MVAAKIIYATIGLVSTALGIIGIWVPGLPTTVFILIALWAFSNSSKRLYAWLNRIPMMRQAILEAKRFQQDRSVSLQVKFIAQLSAWLSFIGVTVLIRSVVLSVIVGVLATACSIFMYVVPTRAKQVEVSRE